jgi:uncharacterized protein
MSSLPPPQADPPGLDPEADDERLVPSRLPAGRRADEPPWRAWTAPAAVGLGLAIGIFASNVIVLLSGAAGSSLSHPTPAVSLISDAAFDLSFVAAALYLARVGSRVGHRGVRITPADFGYRPVALGLGVGAFLTAGISYYVVSYIYAVVFALHGSDKLPSELGVSKSTAALVGATIFVCVVAPVAEELFFRGFIFGALRRMRIVIAGRDLGTLAAAVITGILFGLAHLGSASIQYLIPLGFLGFVLCLLRWRTRSLYPCMALHSVNNSLALGVNQLGWNSGEIVGLMVGSLLVIAAATGPVARRAAAAPA